MRAGRLDRLITIERLTLSNTNGVKTESWAALFSNLPATVVQQSGREAMQQGGGAAAEVDTVFTIRYLSGVLETDRVSWNSRKYDIKFIRQLGRRGMEGLELHARFNQAASQT